MNQQSRNTWRILALWMIVASLAMPAVAQDDEPEEDAPVNVVDGVADANFDQWIFQEVVQLEGNRLVRRSVNSIFARDKLEAQIKSMLNDLVKACNLTDDQRRKLSLAARGDVKQFFDQVDEARKKYVAMKNAPNRINEIWPEISPLQQQYQRGLFGETSLFGKTLRKTLTEPQQAKYQAALLERRRAGYRTVIEASLANLRNGVVLRREQREVLLNHLLAGTSPPLLFGRDDQNVVMLGLSRLPPEVLKEVLDKGQWKQLQPHLNRANEMEGYLAESGVIEEPKPAAVVILRSVRKVIESK